VNYLPDDELRDPKKPKGPSTSRVAIWIIVGAIGLYMVVSGLIGIITKGG
jgi:hypothetical protein